MFVGHLAVALAARRATPNVNLGWHVGAATMADLLWPILVLAGVERVAIVPGATAVTPLVFESYPWSHSLVMLAVWGVVYAALARMRGIGARAAGVLAALVVSHWVLDVITHAPDMPLWPGMSPRYGLALWDSIPFTLLVEGALWVASIAIYLRGRRAINWRASALFWSLVVISTLMWVASPWSPPPNDVRELALFSLIGWIVVPWAAFADRGYRP